MDDIYLYHDAPTINLSGGTVSGIIGAAGSYESKINIIGYGLAAVPYGGSSGVGVATGYWNDDTSFSIDLTGSATYGHIVLYDGVIPANCVNPPEGDISGDCVVNLLDLTKMASEWLLDGTQ